MPSTSSQAEAILAQLQTVGSAYAEKKQGAREQLLNLSHALISSLELPSEAIQRMGWAEPARAAHSRIAVELKVFEFLKESGAQGVGAKDLAAKTGADEALIDTMSQLPFFAWLDQNPPYLQVFNNYMSAYRAGKPSWVDPGFYPVSDRLAEGFDRSNSDVLLVDVGGSMGHDLQELKTKHPSLPGKLILQDRPEVISAVSDTGGVFEATSHDFFTPQPVKGARAYYLHSVLHDWGDDDCVKILEQLKPAIKPGYSKVLINEIIVPSQNPTWPVTSMDQLMLALGAMKERTQMDWESILKRAGLKVVDIYSYEMGSESLIEAEFA